MKPTPKGWPRVSVSVYYQDASKAIDWLCKAFGFEKKMVVPAEGGRVAHAELVLGNGMIMLGSALDSDFGRLVRQPDEIAAPAGSRGK